MALTQLTNLFNIIVSPREIFEELVEQPKWVFAFIIITVINIIIEFYTLPFTHNLMLNQLETQIGEDAARQTLEMTKQYQYIGLAFSPISYLIKLLIVSMFLFFSAIILNAQNLRFKMIFALLIHSEIILIFMNIINLLILYVKGINTITDSTDMYTIYGLIYFLQDKASNQPLFTFLNNFNLFTIWYLLTLTLGISIVTHLKKWKSAIIVLFVWLLGAGFQSSIVILSENMKRMLGQ